MKHLLDARSTATHLTVGAQVEVVDHPLERDHLGLRGELVGFTRPHGYAAVRHGSTTTLVHPEALRSR